MAKRIKVKGAPRGLSKAQRMEQGLERKWASQVRRLRQEDTGWSPIDPALEHVSNFIEPGDYIYTSTKKRRARYMGGQSKPSSTRKKLVKEGNRKFIGPRQLKNQSVEEEASITRSLGGGGPDPSRNYGKGNIRGARFKEQSQPDFESIGSDRLQKLLMDILYKRGLRLPF